MFSTFLAFTIAAPSLVPSHIVSSGLLLLYLQCAEIVHQIPGFFRLHHVGERRHRRAVNSGHENPIEVLVGTAALGAIGRSEIVWPDRLIVAVGKSRSRRPITTAFLPMALPAFQLLEEFSAMLNACHCQRSVPAEWEWVSRLFRLKARRERLDESHKVGALLGRQRFPAWHVREIESPIQGIVQILVQWNVPVGVDRHLNVPCTKLRGFGFT